MRKKLITALMFIMLFLLLGVSACQKPPGAEVTMDKKSITVHRFQSAELSLTVTNTSELPVLSFSNQEIAQAELSADAKTITVFAYSYGQTELCVKVGEAEAKCTIIVPASALVPVVVSEWSDGATVLEGSSDIVLNPALKFGTATLDAQFSYTSSDQSVVKVDSDGSIQAFLPGTAIVTVQAEYLNISQTLSITITVLPDILIELEVSDITLYMPSPYDDFTTSEHISAQVLNGGNVVSGAELVFSVIPQGSSVVELQDNIVTATEVGSSMVKISYTHQNGHEFFAELNVRVLPVPLYDVSHLRGWYFEEGTQATITALPQKADTVEQEYVFEYLIEDKQGSIDYRVEVNPNEITLKTASGGNLAAGDYTLTVKGVTPGGKTVSVSVEISVLATYDYLKNIASGDTPQYLSRLSGDNRFTQRSHVYLDESVYGVPAAYKVQGLAHTTQWDARFQFANDITKVAQGSPPARWQLMDYSAITMEIYIESMEGAFAPYFTNYDSLVDKQTLQPVAKSQVATGKWYIYTQFLTDVATENKETFFYFIGEDQLMTFYVRNIQLHGKSDLFAGNSYYDMTNQQTKSPLYSPEQNFEYVALDEQVYGISTAYHYSTNGIVDDWASRIEMTHSLYSIEGKKYFMDTLTSFSFDIYIIECKNANGEAVYIRPTLFGGAITITDKLTGDTVTTEQVVVGRWYTYEFDITDKTDTLYLYLASNAQYQAYFANFALQ